MRGRGRGGFREEFDPRDDERDREPRDHRDRDPREQRGRGRPMRGHDDFYVKPERGGGRYRKNPPPDMYGGPPHSRYNQGPHHDMGDYKRDPYPGYGYN